MELVDFLKWAVCGGGAGVIAYFLMEEIPALTYLEPKPKRYMSLALAAVIAMLGYMGMVALNYMPQPESLQGWIEGLFSVIGVSSGLGQIIHGKLKL